jgi:hypothetical protein
MQKGQLKDLWVNQRPKTQEDDELRQEGNTDQFDYKTDALQYTIQLMKNIENQTNYQMKKTERYQLLVIS